MYIIPVRNRRKHKVTGRESNMIEMPYIVTRNYFNAASSLEPGGL